MKQKKLSLQAAPVYFTSGLRTDIMLTVDDARRLADAEPDVAELLRAFEEVDRYYREALAALAAPETDIAPVLSSAEVTVSFQPTFVTFDLSHNEH